MAVRIIYLIVLFIFIIIGLSYSEEQQSISTEETFKLCGRRIPHALNLVCLRYTSFEQDEDSEATANRLRRETLTNAPLNGIASQCCLKGCSEEELRKFCPVIHTYASLNP